MSKLSCKNILRFQYHQFGTIGGINLDFIAYYILSATFLSALSIFTIPSQKIQNYCKNQELSTFCKIFAFFFPLIFVSLEHSHVTRLITVKSGLKKEALKKSYLNEYEKELAVAKSLDDQFTEISKILSEIRLLDTIFENYPQSLVMLSIALASIEYERLQSLITGTISANFGDYNLILAYFVLTTLRSLTTIVIKIR